MNKSKRLNTITISVRVLIVILSLLPISLIFELSKLIIPVSAIGGAFRGIIGVGLFITVWKLVLKIYLPNPKLLKRILKKIKGLPTGWYRLSLILWFTIPIILFIVFSGDEEIAIFSFFASLILYWPLHLLILWVVNGFRNE